MSSRKVREKIRERRMAFDRKVEENRNARFEFARSVEIPEAKPEEKPEEEPKEEVIETPEEPAEVKEEPKEEKKPAKKRGRPNKKKESK